MTIYLVIITTVLVFTQLIRAIRVLQNWKQLKRLEGRYEKWLEIEKDYWMFQQLQEICNEHNKTHLSKEEPK